MQHIFFVDLSTKQLNSLNYEDYFNDQNNLTLTTNNEKLKTILNLTQQILIAIHPIQQIQDRIYCSNLDFCKILKVHQENQLIQDEVTLNNQIKSSIKIATKLLLSLKNEGGYDWKYIQKIVEKDLDIKVQYLRETIENHKKQSLVWIKHIQKKSDDIDHKVKQIKNMIMRKMIVQFMQTTQLNIQIHMENQKIRLEPDQQYYNFVQEIAGTLNSKKKINCIKEFIKKFGKIREVQQTI